jgi:uncharacterized protein YaiL (DUF2058 family)
MAKKKNKTGATGGSLQDQLKRAGLVTDKQLRKANKAIHRQEVRVKQGIDEDVDRRAATDTIAEKQARDRAKNREIQAAAEVRALQGQISQIINMNRQRQPGDVRYNFTEQNKVKTIYVSTLNKTQLNSGHLAIVKYASGYELVPEKVARKIRTRSEDIVLYLYDRSAQTVDADDPYKDFAIPDDLDW